jgi:hypothetical protein
MPAEYPGEYGPALTLPCDDDSSVVLHFFDAESDSPSDFEEGYCPPEPCVEIHTACGSNKLAGVVLDRHAMAQLADWALGWKHANPATTDAQEPGA